MGVGAAGAGKESMMIEEKTINNALDIAEG